MRTKLTIAALVAVMIAGTASAEVKENVKVPTTLLQVIPCSGDLVVVQGYMHILMTSTEDENGGIHGKVHFQPQGLSGVVVVGPNMGAKYQATGVTQDTVNAKKGQTYTYINNYRWIGQGQAPNFMVHETWHITINANGELTAVVDNVKVTCR